MGVENKRKPKEGWRQLNFKTIICLPDAKCAAVFFFILFIFSLILTSVILSYSYKIEEKHFDIFSFPSELTTKTLTFPSKISGPVYLYLEYQNYYQNHRIYLKSRSKDQLAGHYDSTLSTDCAPLINYGDLNLTIGNPPLYTKGDEIYPCGLMPASFYDFSIDLFTNKSLPINISRTSIA